MMPGLDDPLALVEVEALREELIGCKLREAESNLSIKKLQHEIHEVSHYSSFISIKAFSRMRHDMFGISEYVKISGNTKNFLWQIET